MALCCLLLVCLGEVRTGLKLHRCFSHLPLCSHKGHLTLQELSTVGLPALQSRETLLPMRSHSTQTGHLSGLVKGKGSSIRLVLFRPLTHTPVQRTATLIRGPGPVKGRHSSMPGISEDPLCVSQTCGVPIEAFDIDTSIWRMKVVDKLPQGVYSVLDRPALHPCKCAPILQSWMCGSDAVRGRFCGRNNVLMCQLFEECSRRWAVLTTASKNHRLGGADCNSYHWQHSTVDMGLQCLGWETCMRT